MKQETVNIEGSPHKLNDFNTEVFYNLKWREILEDQEGKNYFLLYKKRGKNYVIYLDENIIKYESKEVKEGGELFTGGEWVIEKNMLAFLFGRMNQKDKSLLIHTATKQTQLY